MKYFLVGYMASGKTRKGKSLALQWGIHFIDLDTYIVDREKRTIPQIFEQDGEAGFRALERRYLQEVCSLYENFVMATGGGTPCFYDNMDFMNSQGKTIFLNPGIDTIVERLKRGKYRRPLVQGLKDEEIEAFVTKHMQERLPYYKMAQEEDGN